jgi:hypothetical protein
MRMLAPQLFGSGWKACSNHDPGAEALLNAPHSTQATKQSVIQQHEQLCHRWMSQEVGAHLSSSKMVDSPV